MPQSPEVLLSQREGSEDLYHGKLRPTDNVSELLEIFSGYTLGVRVWTTKINKFP